MADVATLPRRPAGVLLSGRTLALRVLGMVAILLVLSFLIFSLVYLAPGDIVKNLLGPKNTSPEAIAAVRAQYHLDDPFLVQYWNWLSRAVTGDFGTSTRNQESVAAVIGGRVGTTLALCGISFVLAVGTAIPLGVLSATRSGGFLDRTISAWSVVGLSAPAFAVSLLLLYAFSFYLPLFPGFGGGDSPLDSLYHLVLPAIALAIGLGAILVKLTRTALLRELHSDYVVFARARGLSPTRVTRIALRNASIPIVTGAGLTLSYLVGGTILVETTFALPGLGTLLQSSVLFKDVAVVQALALLVAVLIAVIALLTDLSYALLDPRVRLAGDR